MTMTDDTPMKNQWRLESPGHTGWVRTARPDDPNKYFMVSADNHHTEPKDYFDHIEPQYRDRVPRLEPDDNGALWLVCEGSKPLLVKPGAKPKAPPVDGAVNKFGSQMDAEDVLRSRSALTVAMRLGDQERDGVDAEVVYPNRGLLCFATPDPLFAAAMCRAFNRWSNDYFADVNDRIVVPALISGGDVAQALAEIEWAASTGHVAVMLGSKPVWGPTNSGDIGYNDPSFDPMWAAL